MSPALIAIGLGALALIAFVLFWSALRERWLLRGPFPGHWREIVQRRLPFLERMEEGERIQLERLIRLFLGSKTFYGCGGMEIDDEVRVTIAAEACLLLLNRPTGIYPGLQHILVYPSAFIAEREEIYEDGTVANGRESLLGESWDSGKIILSWDDVENGARNFGDGFNVVLHEFSHQLDYENGLSDGAPALPHGSYRSWAEVLSAEFEGLIEAIEHDHHGVLDHYGATDPAEFFAVATETFFEKPGEMAHRHPRLFEEFKAYYRVDPRKWK